jgi:co-chaperonin GroES (HSP10)
MKPIGNNIYFEPLSEHREGLVGAAYVDAKPEVGKVLAIGEGVKEVKVGDKIVFKGYGVVVPEINDEKYYFIQEDPNILLAVYE